LAAIVVVSLIVRVVIGRSVVAPWIMVDEIDYSELAKSFAARGHFLIRGVPSNGYGLVYPLLIAPAYRTFGAIPDAYRAAKAINGALMSLAAIPAYLLARRVLSVRSALIVAALTLLMPSILYTSTLMTENAFYPIFLTCALALVMMLERPSPARQVVVVLACLLAYATRAQAVCLFPAILSAPLVLVLVEHRGVRGLRQFATLFALLGGGIVLALVESAARHVSPSSLLGPYRAATTSTYTVGGVLRFFVYHVAEFDLSIGVVPFAALLALWLAPRSVAPAARAFGVASLALVVWLLVVVAAFASQTSVDKIEERNTFYLAPLALVALLGLAEDGVVPRSRRCLLTAAAIASVLPVFIPYGHFVNSSATADTFALLPLWWMHDHGVALSNVRWLTLAVGIAGGGLLVWLPRRLTPLLAVFVAGYFVVTTFVVENGRHGIAAAARGKLQAAVRGQRPDWIDRAVGRNASVAVLYTGETDQALVWESEFFNRSVERIFDFGASAPDPLPATQLLRSSSGVLTANGRPVRVTYLLARTSVDVKGHVLATDPGTGVALYRVDGRIVLLSRVAGLYPDRWSGRTVTYRRLDCTGGRLTVLLQSDPLLFASAQDVTATSAGQVIARASVAPTAVVRLGISLRAREGVCAAQFDVARVANPSLIEAGSTDNRSLGVRFLWFRFQPF